MKKSEAEQIRREKLFSLFDKIESTKGTLIIGGDFFDFWFDYKYVVPKGFNDILYRLESLYKSGIQIHYVLGNHDYCDYVGWKRSSKKWKDNFNSMINLHKEIGFDLLLDESREISINNNKYFLKTTTLF